ncbi:MAG: hypothetical protein OEY59_04490 [Deltaproteobacteria bacterium]|nr:hypothetical protein [Deltaproteobacteria bacterium]
MKQYGEFFIVLDHSGFPMIRKKNWNYFISLFPVSVYQLSKCFNLTMDDAQIDQRWKAFARGIPSDGLMRYIQHQTKEDTDFFKGQYKLPNEEQWSALLENAPEIKALKPQLETFCSEEPISDSARNLIMESAFPLVEEGVLELIDKQVEHKTWFDDTVFCMGKPSEDLWPNTWNPRDVREIYWWIPTSENGNKDEEGPDEGEIELCFDEPKGRDLVGFRMVKEIPSLDKRIMAVKKEAEQIQTRDKGYSSMQAVYGPEDQPYNKPRFRYLSTEVRQRKLDLNTGFNQKSDIFFLGILLLEAINGFPMMTLNDIDHIFGRKTMGYPGFTGQWTEFNESVAKLITQMIETPQDIKLQDLPLKFNSLLQNLN